MRILIAEDNLSTRNLLVKLLSKWGHEVVEAEDGAQAWEYLQKNPVSLVVSDWMMPNMDGLELCTKVRNEGFDRYIYFILLTAKDTKSKIVEGMEAGADDYVIKPFDINELKVRIRAGERIINLESTLEEKNEILNKAYSDLRLDIEAAGRMQKSLLPNKSTVIDNIKFESIFLPCSIVAGDIFNYHRLDENNICFYLIDVVGHGVPAAMLSVTLSKILSWQVEPNSPLKCFVQKPPYYKIIRPAEAITELNKRFQTDTESMQYFTMIYGIINTKEEKLVISQAGHPHPIIVKQGKNLSFIDGGGLPVGMFENSKYDETELDFNVGDRLVIYSDGITECLNENREQYSLEGFINGLVQNNDLGFIDVFEQLKEHLLKWRGTNEFEDDVSILSIANLGEKNSNFLSRSGKNNRIQ